MTDLVQTCKEMLKHPSVYELGIFEGIGKTPSFLLGQCLTCHSSVAIKPEEYQKIETMYVTVVRTGPPPKTARYERHDIWRRIPQETTTEVSNLERTATQETTPVVNVKLGKSGYSR